MKNLAPHRWSRVLVGGLLALLCNQLGEAGTVLDVPMDKEARDNLRVVAEKLKTIEALQTRIKTLEDVLGGVDLVKLAGDVEGTNKGLVELQAQGKQLIRAIPFKENAEAARDLTAFVAACWLDNRPGNQEKILELQRKYQYPATINPITGKANPLNEGTDSEGGYLVPDEFRAEVYRQAEQTSVTFPRITKIPTQGKTMNAAGIATEVFMTWEDEAAAITEGSPTFNQPTVPIKKLAAISTVSNEELADEKVGLVTLLSALFTEAWGAEFDKVVLQYTGSPYSAVLLQAGTSVVMDSGSTNFSAINFTNLIQMIRKVKTQSRNNAAWFMHRLNAGFLATAKDSNDAFRLSLTGTGRGFPNIHGYPVIESEQMISTSAANTPFVLFGDLKWAAMTIRQDLAMASSKDVKFINDQTVFRWTNRMGLLVPASTATAFCKLETAAS